MDFFKKLKFFISVNLHDFIEAMKPKKMKSPGEGSEVENEIREAQKVTFVSFSLF